MRKYERSIQVGPNGTTAKELKSYHHISHVVERTPTSKTGATNTSTRARERQMTTKMSMVTTSTFVRTTLLSGHVKRQSGQGVSPSVVIGQPLKNDGKLENKASDQELKIASSSKTERKKKSHGDAVSTSSNEQQGVELNPIEVHNITISAGDISLNSSDKDETPIASQNIPLKSHHNHDKPCPKSVKKTRAGKLAVKSTKMNTPTQEHTLLTPPAIAKPLPTKRTVKRRNAEGLNYWECAQTVRRNQGQAKAAEGSVTPSTSSSYDQREAFKSHSIKPTIVYTPDEKKVRNGNFPTITPKTLARGFAQSGLSMPSMPDRNIPLTQEIGQIHYKHAEQKRDIETEPGVDFLQTLGYTDEPIFAAELSSKTTNK